GDTQIVWQRGKVTIYDASSNTVYRATLPARHGEREHAREASEGAPSPARIAKALAKVREHVAVSGARPTDVGGRPAYTVALGPKRNGGLLGSVELAWDAFRGVP